MIDIRKIEERARLYIESCPDKSQNKATISKKFKKDLTDYLVSRGANENFLEMGASYGHTTQLLSILCDSVVTVDNDKYLIDSINNMGYPNVTAVCHDLYDDVAFMNLVSSHTPFQVALIDAVHTYKHSLSDAIKAIVLECDVLVFDDIGLFDGVNNAHQRVVSEATRLGIPCNNIPVGNPAGFHAHGEKVFKRPEGVILELGGLSDNDHTMRKKLIQSLLVQEQPMTEKSWKVAADSLEAVVEEKMKAVEASIMASGDESKISSFKNDHDKVESTRQNFRKTIINEAASLLEINPRFLPDPSLPDVLSAIKSAGEEFQVTSNN